MPQRMIFYWLLTDEKYNEYPKQYLFYIGNEPLTMLDHLPELGDAYKYKIIDFHDIDCEKFINSGKPEEIVISILCNFRGKDGRIMKRDVIRRIRETVASEMLQSKYIRQVQVLSQIKGLDEIESEEEEEMLIYDVEKDPYYKRGKMEGLTEGQQKGKQEGRLEGKQEGRLEGLIEAIELGLELKYGFQGLELMDMARRIGTVDRLAEFKELIKKSRSVDELKVFLKGNS